MEGVHTSNGPAPARVPVPLSVDVDLSYGMFGENLTVDGLPDDEVCIGDRHCIGEAEFEVIQPHVTCYRVGMRPGQPEAARAAGEPSPSRLLHARHHRRAHQAGDPIEKLWGARPGESVARTSSRAMALRSGAPLRAQPGRLIALTLDLANRVITPGVSTGAIVCLACDRYAIS